MAQEKLFWDEPGSRERLIEILQSGQIILGTSDTILGLLAPLTEVAVKRLNDIKMRVDKPYIILIGDAGRVSSFVLPPISTRLESLANQCWPGPLTLIMRAKDTLPRYLLSPQGTVALRVPRHDGLLSLLQNFPGLFSTSANKAGHPAPPTLEVVDPDIRNMISCIVSDRKDQPEALPSTILDCTGERPRVIREGAYRVEELERAYGEPFER